ncbi:MAG: DUF1080 domain-containing protein, partial [Acidobacteria bacterium]|nr:DUF1080 domain-containing protein [Acidobacteriota bacterium]
MRPIALTLFACACLSAQVNSLTPKEISDGWILLFDGESLFGWTPEGKAEWQIAGGALVADSSGSGWL